MKRILFAALVLTVAGLVWSQTANLAPRPEGDLAGARPGNGPFAGEPVRLEDGRLGIGEPMRITEPGSYVLTRDVFTTENRVFEIEASDVLFDLNGFTVETASATGIQIGNDVENVTVRNGTIRANARAVYLLGTFSVLEDLQLVADTAVLTGGAYWPRIERCRIYGRETGIEVSYAKGTTIAHNNFGGYYGNACVLLHNESRRTTIKNNTLNNCGDAIMLVDHPNATIADNEIETSRFGIRLSRSHGASITRNTFSSSSRAAVEILDSNGTSVTDNTIVGGDGIWLADALGTQIVRNSITYAGIHLYGGSWYNRLEDNHVTLASLTGIFFGDHAEYNIYRGNTARGNSPNFQDYGHDNTSHGDNYMPDLQ